MLGAGETVIGQTDALRLRSRLPRPLCPPRADGRERSERSPPPLDARRAFAALSGAMSRDHRQPLAQFRRARAAASRWSSCIIPACATRESAIARLRDPAAQGLGPLSVAEDGQILRLVRRGQARLACRPLLLARHHRTSSRRASASRSSIPATNSAIAPFPSEQIDALVPLVAGDRRSATASRRGNVVGHSDIAPTRKQDPGELFPWARLAQARPGVAAADART